MSFRERYPEAETEAHAHQQIRAVAADSFAEHVITQVSETVWKCHNPKTWNYGFFMARLPGAWVCYGDVGDLMVTRSDTLTWLRQATETDDYGYFLGKMPFKLEKFYPGDALTLLDEHVRDEYIEEKRAEAIIEEWNEYDTLESYECYARAVYEVTGDAELIASKGMSYDAMRCIEAIRWFCAHMPDGLPAPPWRPEPAAETTAIKEPTQ